MPQPQIPPAPQLMPQHKTVNFLIVDDDKVSILAMRRALKKLKIVNPVQIAHDGREALEILRGDAGQDKIAPPYLVTLDLNMPRMGGLEFLEEVRKDPQLHNAIIFVLTTSDAPVDIASAYEKNIAGYLLKDNASESLAKAFDMINTFSRIVVLPD